MIIMIIMIMIVIIIMIIIIIMMIIIIIIMIMIIIKLKEGICECFTLCALFIKVISLIYEKKYFGDRVPLK